MKRTSSIVIAAIMLSGCGAPLLPDEYALPDNAKVGLYVVADEYPKHTHFDRIEFEDYGSFFENVIGELVISAVESAFNIGNFVEVYEYDWNIANSIYDIFKKKIEYNTKFETIDLESMNIDLDRRKMDLVEYDLWDRQWRYNEKNEQLRLRFLKEGIYAIVYIYGARTEAEEAEDDSGDNHYLHSDGYGLYTSSLESSMDYYASASFNYSIEIIQPPIDLTRIGDFKYVQSGFRKNMKMTDFDAPEDFRNITETELDPVREQILAYFEWLADLTVKYLRGEVK